MRNCLIAFMVLHVFSSFPSMADGRLTESHDYYRKSGVEVRVEKVKVDGLTGTENENGWIGSGFFIDPAAGIIATNSHIFSANVIGQPYVKMFDGHVYGLGEVELLYANPTGHQFDFSLLRIKNLLPQHKNLPVPFFQENPTEIKKGLKVGSIGVCEETNTHFKGIVTEVYGIGEGETFNYMTYPYYTFSQGCEGCFGGSPVYNARKEIIGIISAGSLLQTHVVPIRYVLDALRSWRLGIPLTIYTLGLNIRTEEMSRLREYCALKDAPLAREISANPNYTQRVMQIENINPLFRKDNPELQVGDIIKRVGGVAVGPDFGRLHDLVMAAGKAHEKIHLTLDREGQTVEVDVTPMEFPYEPIKAIQFPELIFVQANSTIAYHYGIQRGLPVSFPNFPCGEAYAMIIRKVSGKDVSSFDAMVQALHDLRQKGRTKFTLTFDMGNVASTEIMNIDTSECRNANWSITQKDASGAWVDVDYDTYVNGLEAAKGLSVKRMAVEAPSTGSVRSVTTKTGSEGKEPDAKTEKTKGKRGRSSRK